MSNKGYQSRKFLLTINNPLDFGMNHDEIIDRAQRFNPDYFCLADEIAASGTPHTHLYLYSSAPMRWETVKGRFPTATLTRLPVLLKVTATISVRKESGRIPKKLRPV